jgi:hypothetical protein
MTETNRQYDNVIATVALHVAMVNALRQQILVAVENRYLMELEHPDLGFVVTPRDMLTYLNATYGTLTPVEVEANRNTLTATWNPDEGIESLWLRIRDAQALARHAQEPILDDAAIRLTVLALEATGVFTFALDNWRLKDDATKTMAAFKEHFSKENEERIRKLTAKTGGYHGAHSATAVPTNPDSNSAPTTANPDSSAATTTAQPSTVTPLPHVLLTSGVKMYYCWSHGLSKNANHTGFTCTNRSEGHIESATADNIQGGNSNISRGRGQRRGPVRTQARS